MSYNPPPPPAHPNTSTQTRPVYKMAATQLPPLGPHTFLPSPSAGRYHENLHSASIPNLSSPRPPVLFHKSHEGITQPNVTSPRVPPIRTAYQSPPKKRQSAVPVESLLQSEPYSPSYSRTVTSPRYAAQISPRTLIGPSVLHTSPLIDPAAHLPTRCEPSESRGRYSFREEQRFSAALPSSPSHRSHRDSATSCYSSGTSSSDHRTGPVVLSQPTSSLPAGPVQPHV